MEAASKAESLSVSRAEEMLDTHAVSLMTGMSSSWLHYARQNGDGPPYYRLGARRCLYRRADVEAWMAARRDPSGSSSPLTDNAVPFQPQAST